MGMNSERIKRDVLLNSLFLDYGKERFLGWCRTLKFFRFYKSHPYPDDLKPDRFIALTSFRNDIGLDKLFVSLEIIMQNRKEKLPTSKEIKSTFSAKVTVFGVFCYIDVNKTLKTIMLEVSGNETDQFSLDDTTFQRVKQIDECLSNLHINFISSPYGDDYCITPEFYPEVWEE